MNVQLQTAKNTSRRRSVSDSPAALPALERRRLQSYLALMCRDIAMLFAAFTFAGWFYLGLAGAESAAELAQLLLPVYLTIALYNGAYSLRALQDASYGGGRSVSRPNAGSKSRFSAMTEATCSAVGKVSLLDWPWLT
jgi:hypothetical protein